MHDCGADSFIVHTIPGRKSGEEAGLQEQEHVGRVVSDDAPTTSVTAGVLTITIGGSTDNKIRTFQIFAY